MKCFYASFGKNNNLKNVFNKVTSFRLRFVSKRDFDCEQV